MTTARYNQPCQSSVRYWMMQPCVVAGSSNAEKPTHYLDAELISMRFDELVRSPGFAWSLAHRHDGYLQPRTQILALVQEKLVTPDPQSTCIRRGEFGHASVKKYIRVPRQTFEVAPLMVGNAALIRRLKFSLGKAATIGRTAPMPSIIERSTIHD